MQQGSSVHIHAVLEPATAAGAAIFRASPGGQNPQRGGNKLLMM
jgi:hypothetical protein